MPTCVTHNTATSEEGRVTPPAGLFAAMLTLGLGGFFIGTGEFASMSLLPSLATGTGVSVPEAGSYISAYAIGVVVGAPLIAVVGARWPRKRLLLGLLMLVTLGYLASAMAWNEPSLLVARFISGLPHGAWYGVGGLAASVMVPASRRTQYIGYVMLGLAAANVAGVPAMTWLGQHLGWRAAFLFVAAGGVLTAIMLFFFLPATPGVKNVSLLHELTALRKPQVWLTFAVASIGFGGMFAVYTYITPTLIHVSQFDLATVPMVLVVWGVGMVCGNIVGGWLADRALVPAIVAMLLWNVACLALFSLVAHIPWAVVAVLFLLGNGFALVPALQAQFMDVAQDAQTLAASLNHCAFNIANAIGASLGGVAISAGAGWASTGWVGALLAAAGSGIMCISIIYAKRH